MNEYDIDVDARLRAAVDHATPDVLADILSKCDDKKTGEIVELPPRKKSGKLIKSLCSMAAVLALLFCGTFSYGKYQVAHAVDSVVTFADGEVELDVNRSGEVLEVRTAEGSEGITEGMDLVGKTIEDAAAELLTSLESLGKLPTEDGGGAITVKGKDPEKMDALHDALTTTLADIIAKAAQTAGEGASDAVTEAGDAISEAIGGPDGADVGKIVEGVTDAAGELAGGVGETVGEVVEGVGETVGTVIDDVGKTVDDTLTGVGGVLESVVSGIGDLSANLYDWVSGHSGK